MTAIVDITYYTDPLCSWSWAFEPVWRRLRFEMGERLSWRYRMGGMIPDWRRFADPINDIGSPGHMGPYWLEVSRLSGMPIEPGIWHEAPPASSYPACLAVKAAELQGRELAERYLRRAREAVMLERRNIALRSVLLELAEELTAHSSKPEAEGGALNVAAFRGALESGVALAALREDLRDTKYRDIGRFPTLIIRGRETSGVVLVGFRPYDVLAEAVRQVAGAEPSASSCTPTATQYRTFWQGVTSRLTEREMMEVCGLPPPVVEPASPARQEGA